MVNLASKVSPEGPKWSHREPLWMHFGHLGHSFANFCTFYQVFVNNYAFLLKIHVETTKLQQNAAKIMSIAQEHRKSG